MGRFMYVKTEKDGELLSLNYMKMMVGLTFFPINTCFPYLMPMPTFPHPLYYFLT